MANAGHYGVAGVSGARTAGTTDVPNCVIKAAERSFRRNAARPSASQSVPKLGVYLIVSKGYDGDEIRDPHRMTLPPQSSPGALSAWDAVLTSLCHLQRVLPDAVAVGGTASALYAGHRLSFDHDHVLPDLRVRFDEVLADLEAVAGWKTARIRRPHLILGSLDGVETGVRQLRRVQPLETTLMRAGAHEVRLPTLQEILRIKAFLCLDRNATRDYLDLAALTAHQGVSAATAALATMDELYPQKNGDPWAVRTQLIKQLADPRPYDLDGINLAEYKGIKPPLDQWGNVAAVCAGLSEKLVDEFTAILNADTSPEAEAARHSLANWRDAHARGERPALFPLPGLKT